MSELEGPPREEIKNTIPDWASGYLVEENFLDHGPKSYQYAILSSRFNEEKIGGQLPQFEGFPPVTSEGNRFLFISEAVPVQYHEPWLRHEVREFTETNLEDEEACLNLLKQELEEIPENLDRNEYIQARYNYFKDLVAFLSKSKSEQDQKIAKKASKSLDYLMELIAEVEK